MAGYFTKNTANWMGLGVHKLGVLVNGGAKVAFHARIYPNSFTTGTNDNSIFIAWLSGDIAGFRMGIDGSGSTSVLKVGGRSVNTDTFQSKAGSTRILLNQWTSVVGMLDIPNDTIYLYVNGVLDAIGSVSFANTTYTDSAGSVNDAIGSGDNHATTASQFDGFIENFALWKFGSTHPGFSTGELADLAEGINPRHIESAYLVSNWALDNQNLTTQYDDVGQLTGTITGSIPVVTGQLFPIQNEHWLFSDDATVAPPTTTTFLSLMGVG